MKLILVSTLVLMIGISLEAQPNCRKGKPCGNSCIARTKVCRIGPPAPAPQPSRGADTARARSTRADSLASAERNRRALLAAPADTSRSAFVGDASRRMFFRRGCAAALRVKEEDLVVFVTETEAKTAGYARSGAEGC